MSYGLGEDDVKRLMRVLSRTAVDPEFRELALKDPHAAIQEAIGVALPASFKIQFAEQPKELDALVVLPPLSLPSQELSDAELEAVAGGDDEDTSTCWYTCDLTCNKSCSKTCSVTDVTVSVVPELT